MDDNAEVQSSKRKEAQGGKRKKQEAKRKKQSEKVKNHSPSITVGTILQKDKNYCSSIVFWNDKENAKKRKALKVKAGIKKHVATEFH